MNPEILPQKPIDLVADLIRLAPPETSSPAHIEATLSYLEARMDSWSAEQDRRLKKAEKRIALCSYLQGFLMGTGWTTDHRMRHFSWCPFEAWMANDHYDGLIESLNARQ